MGDQNWWELKDAIDQRGLRIVAIDLPTSHQGFTLASGDEFTDRVLSAINYMMIDMMIDMMAAIARKDYQQRRERQSQGYCQGKSCRRVQRSPSRQDLQKRVRELLSANLGIRATARHANCSTTTVMRIRDELSV